MNQTILTEEQLLERVEYMTNVVFPAISRASKDRQQAMVDHFKGKVVANPFPDGSYVMTLDPLSTSKLQAKWEGPFKVVRRTHGGTYVLSDLQGALLTRNYSPSQMKLVKRDPIDDEGDIFVIQQILNHRLIPSTRGKMEYEYLVSWKGYSDEHNSWIPFSNFIDTAIVEAYRKRRGLAASHSFDSQQPISTGRGTTGKRQRATKSSELTPVKKRAKLQPSSEPHTEVASCMRESNKGAVGGARVPVLRRSARLADK